MYIFFVQSGTSSYKYEPDKHSALLSLCAFMDNFWATLNTFINTLRVHEGVKYQLPTTQ